MSKILQVAWREFVATVATKGFIIGVLVTPVLIGAMLFLLPALLDEEPPPVEGEVAVLDPTRQVAERVREHLSPRAIVRRRESVRRELEETAVETLGERMPPSTSLETLKKVADTSLERAPMLEVVELSPSSDLATEKARLLEQETDRGGRLALLVFDPHAVEKGDRDRYGSYDLYIREKLDDRIESEVHDAARQAVLEARVEARGLDPREIGLLTRVERPSSTTVTEEGEKETNPILNMMIPLGFMGLLLVSVLTGGQYIMTTTIEEKSSRVVEVLLSAVSPIELMTGKILGQMAVGLVILVLYAGMGVAALVSFAFVGLVEPVLFLYLILFYLIAYFVVASLMAAIGSAVNELREAQTLMTPIMVMMMIPWLLWLPISRDPGSPFAVVTSFLPPINSFVMLLRVASTSPPPAWQVWLSIAIDTASVYGALWFAAKVFRIGLLMHGKPPNLATLLRWVRMA